MVAKDWKDKEGKTAKVVPTLSKDMNKLLHARFNREVVRGKRYQNATQITFSVNKNLLCSFNSVAFSSKSLGLLEGSILEAH